jgi:hypothetical protein
MMRLHARLSDHTNVQVRALTIIARLGVSDTRRGGLRSKAPGWGGRMRNLSI